MNGYFKVWGRVKAYWGDPQGRIVLCAALLLVASVPLNYLMLRLTGWSVLWPTRTWLTATLLPAEIPGM